MSSHPPSFGLNGFCHLLDLQWGDESSRDLPLAFQVNTAPSVLPQLLDAVKEMAASLRQGHSVLVYSSDESPITDPLPAPGTSGSPVDGLSEKERHFLDQLKPSESSSKGKEAVVFIAMHLGQTSPSFQRRVLDLAEQGHLVVCASSIEDPSPSLPQSVNNRLLQIHVVPENADLAARLLARREAGQETLRPRHSPGL